MSAFFTCSILGHFQRVCFNFKTETRSNLGNGMIYYLTAIILIAFKYISTFEIYYSSADKSKQQHNNSKGMLIGHNQSQK